MWLSRMISVGRPLVLRKTASASSMRSRSLASPTRSTFQPIAEEARRDILGEGDAGVALDGDVVVVVDPAEVVEAEMAGERGRLRADAFHQAAVAADRVDVVVEDLEAGLVVAAGEPLARDRHADAGGDALPQRTGRRLDARHPVIFRMPRRLAVELAEVADVVERDRRLAQALVLGIHGLGAASGAAPTTAASRRGRSTARSGRGWARSDPSDRSA